MDIASDICIYTNKEFLIECLDEVEEKKGGVIEYSKILVVSEQVEKMTLS
jgi:hypothetical protein